MSVVSDIASIALSAAALGVSVVALRISRRQLTIDARALDLAERQLAIEERQHEAFEREQAARPQLALEVKFHDADARDVVRHPHDVWTAITVTVRNDGDADAPNVHVDIRFPAHGIRRLEWNETLRGPALPGARGETQVEPSETLHDPASGAELVTRRVEQTIDRIYAHGAAECYARMLLNRGDDLPLEVRAWSSAAPHDIVSEARRLRHAGPPA